MAHLLGHFIQVAIVVGAGWSQSSSPLGQLDWLAGCWQSGDERSATVEMWIPPAGGLMVGASRTVKDERATAWEHLRIRADGDRVVYTAIPSGQAETDFVSVEVGEDRFAVENLAHDFPQRIVYHRLALDSMAVRVEGGDGRQGFDIRFRRIDCEVAPPPPSES